MTNKFLLNRLGFNPDLTSRQPRPDSLSLVSRQSDLLTYLGRITAILVLVLTIGVGNAWGADVTIQVSSDTWTSTGTSGSGGATSVTKSGITVSSTKGYKDGTTAIRDYSGSVITISSSVGNISSIAFTCTASETSNNGPGKLAKNESSDPGSYSYSGKVGTWSFGSGTSTVSSVKLKATAQCRWTQVVVTYTADCTTNPTVSAGSNSNVTATTATVSCSGILLLGSAGCSITSYGFVYGTSSNPTTDNTIAIVEVGTSYTTTGTSFTKELTGLTANTTYYVRPYATNGNGTAYGTQTSFTTPALPKYTVTLKDDNSTLTQASAGASVTLPSRTGCTGYTFAGWTKSWVAAQTEWTTTAPTIIPAGSYTPEADENLYPVYTKTEGGGNGFKLSLNSGGTDYYIGAKGSGSYMSAVTDPADAVVFTYDNSRLSFDDSGTQTYISSAGNNTTLTVGTDQPSSTWTESRSSTYTYQSSAAGNRYLAFNGSASPARFAPYGSSYAHEFTKHSISTTSYISVPNCCTELGSINGSINLSQLATPDPTKLKASWTMSATTGIASYTLEVYDSSNNLVKTINNYTSGSEITGLTPCTEYYVKLYTVSSGGEYCAGGLIGTSSSVTTNGYTLTVNKSNVTLSSGSEPTNICSDISATYAASDGYTLPTSISVTNAGAENTGWTWNSSTGVLTINKANVTGNVMVTITGAAQSNFINGETVFIQADSKDYSAWKDDACVKAWFNNNWSGGSAETTYWLFDATDADAGKKLFATVVPASGDLNIVQLQRFAGNCLNKWNDNGSVNKASSNGVNTFRSYGSADNNVAWNGSSTILYLYGSQNSWESSLGTFADQGAGVWTATISNYTPDATSKDYKIKTSYNNGWIGNTGSNNNATLSDMIVGSTYNVTATLNVTTHALTMSKTFVKGTVHFDLQGHGSAIADLTNVAAGSKISAPSPAPNETGWDFGGWYKEAGCTNAWNFDSDEVTETMTLYAKWTEKPKYTITLNAGNGTVSEAGWEKDGDVWKQQQSNGDASITFPSASSNCAGWEFVGWATSAANNVSSDPTSKAAGATLVPTGDVTYYAVYRQNSTGGTTYNKITDIGDLTTGTYVIKTSSYAMRNNADVICNSTYCHMPESSKSGADASITNSDATLDWTIIKFGSNYAIKSGSKFVGIDRDGILVYDETMHLFTAAYDGTNNRWVFTSTENTSYQLVYDTYFRSLDTQKTAILLYKQGAGLTGNYYTNPTCSDLSITGVADPAAGGSVTLSATSAKSGEKVYAYYTEDPAYRFKSWSVSGTGASISSTTAKFTEITVGSADVTLTANFAARVMYSVTWKANGEKLTGVDLGSASTSVETGEKITNLPPNPSSCDGTSTAFVGWIAESDIWSGKTDDVSGVTIYEDVSDFPTVTDDVTYHAVWARQNGSAAPATYAGTGVFTKITTMEELEVGAHYVLYGEKVSDNTVKGAMNNTFSNPASGKYVFGGSSVTISDGKITNPATTIVWKLGGTTNAYTLYSQNSSKYVEITANDARAFSNPSSPTTSFTIDVNEGSFRIMSNHTSASSRMISLYTSTEFRSYANNNTDYVLYLYKYGSNYTYDRYLVKCCNTPTLAFAASPYAVLREDIGGASTTTWAEVDVTFTSNSTGTISAAQYSNATVTNGTAYQLAASKWQVYETTGGTLCGATHAYFEVLTQPSGETPGTGKFHVKTSSGQTGQGTYRIAITQAATDESHGNYCETTVYGFVDVTLRDKFVDNVNGNGTVTRDGHGAQLATPTLSEFDTQEEDACHSEGRKLKGWIKETDLKAQYETGSSTRVQTVDGLCETCADGTDQISLIVAPGEDVTMSGATWYAVWAYER